MSKKLSKEEMKLLHEAFIKTSEAKLKQSERSVWFVHKNDLQHVFKRKS